MLLISTSIEWKGFHRLTSWCQGRLIRNRPKSDWQFFRKKMIPSKVTNNNTELQEIFIVSWSICFFEGSKHMGGEVALERQMQMGKSSFFPISTIAPTTHIQLIFNKATKLFPTVWISDFSSLSYMCLFLHFLLRAH